MRFIDEIHITIASGHGGPGKTSFRREAMTPRGGPDGGDGGRGGDLILKVAHNLNSLVDYRPGKKYGAQNGAPGESSNCFGAAGQDLHLLVPPGTIVRNLEGEILVDMTGITEYTLLKGGRGGKGNHFFKTSVNQAPEHSQPGEPGSEMDVKLELKLIADVGIIGFPNAGKSTLISRISAARPKIADYPFTTLTPNLGVVKAAEFKSFVVADIPGLIKGAHAGAGLGTQFLRHVERTRLFLHLIDVSSMTMVDPIQAYKDIQYELEMYDQNNQGKEGFFPLLERPQIVVLNKIETIPKDDLDRIMIKLEKLLGRKPFAISAVTGKNVESLIFEISKFLFTEEELQT
ncbi:MAG: GTPase ObgE [Bdellovibrionaceae bacterium]|nr:GTPase ObgE [Pseudobdellovibrionaceae bacterium]